MGFTKYKMNCYPGLNFIVAPNGSGKSTIIYSLCLMFGRLRRGMEVKNYIRSGYTNGYIQIFLIDLPRSRKQPTQSEKYPIILLRKELTLDGLTGKVKVKSFINKTEVSQKQINQVAARLYINITNPYMCAPQEEADTMAKMPPDEKLKMFLLSLRRTTENSKLSFLLKQMKLFEDANKARSSRALSTPQRDGSPYVYRRRSAVRSLSPADLSRLSQKKASRMSGRRRRRKESGEGSEEEEEEEEDGIDRVAGHFEQQEKWGSQSLPPMSQGFSPSQLPVQNKEEMGRSANTAEQQQDLSTEEPNIIRVQREVPEFINLMSLDSYKRLIDDMEADLTVKEIQLKRLDELFLREQEWRKTREKFQRCTSSLYFLKFFENEGRLHQVIEEQSEKRVQIDKAKEKLETTVKEREAIRQRIEVEREAHGGKLREVDQLSKIITRMSGEIQTLLEALNGLRSSKEKKEKEIESINAEKRRKLGNTEEETKKKQEEEKRYRLEIEKLQEEIESIGEEIKMKESDTSEMRTKLDLVSVEKKRVTGELIGIKLKWEEVTRELGEWNRFEKSVRRLGLVVDADAERAQDGESHEAIPINPFDASSRPPPQLQRSSGSRKVIDERSGRYINAIVMDSENRRGRPKSSGQAERDLSKIERFIFRAEETKFVAPVTLFVGSKVYLLSKEELEVKRWGGEGIIPAQIALRTFKQFLGKYVVKTLCVTLSERDQLALIKLVSDCGLKITVFSLHTLPGYSRRIWEGDRKRDQEYALAQAETLLPKFKPIQLTDHRGRQRDPSSFVVPFASLLTGNNIAKLALCLFLSLHSILLINKIDPRRVLNIPATEWVESFPGDGQIGREKASFVIDGDFINRPAFYKRELVGIRTERLTSLSNMETVRLDFEFYSVFAMKKPELDREQLESLGRDRDSKRESLDKLREEYDELIDTRNRVSIELTSKKQRLVECSEKKKHYEKYLERWMRQERECVFSLALKEFEKKVEERQASINKIKYEMRIIGYKHSEIASGMVKHLLTVREGVNSLLYKMIMLPKLSKEEESLRRATVQLENVLNGLKTAAKDAESRKKKLTSRCMKYWEAGRKMRMVRGLEVASEHVSENGKDRCREFIESVQRELAREYGMKPGEITLDEIKDRRQTLKIRLNQRTGNLLDDTEDVGTKRRELRSYILNKRWEFEAVLREDLALRVYFLSLKEISMFRLQEICSKLNGRFKELLHMFGYDGNIFVSGDQNEELRSKKINFTQYLKDAIWYLGNTTMPMNPNASSTSNNSVCGGNSPTGASNGVVCGDEDDEDEVEYVPLPPYEKNAIFKRLDRESREAINSIPGLEAQIRFMISGVPSTTQIVNDKLVSSGGEGSLTTLCMMCAMLSTRDDETSFMGSHPFILIDELNQGMDEFNQRVMHKILAESIWDYGAEGPEKNRFPLNTTQIFVGSPKLLSGFEYPENSAIHLLTYTPWDEKRHSRTQMKDRNFFKSWISGLF